MQSSLLCDKKDIQALREFIHRLGANATIVDFEENILLSTIRSTMRLWREDDHIIGVAFLDDYNNLRFENAPAHPNPEKLEDEMIAWGAACMRGRNAAVGAQNTLDCCCAATNTRRIAALEKHGFVSLKIRTLRYSRPLSLPIRSHPLPDGFTIRCVQGKSEVEALVALHRAAFGTDKMTIEERLAMMSTPLYIRELDLVAVASDGELAAFCVCGFDDPDKKEAFTDPIGTHPRYRRMGLAQTIVTTGLKLLKEAGAEVTTLGTSSENHALQNLAKQLGYVCVSDKRWFAKNVL